MKGIITMEFNTAYSLKEKKGENRLISLPRKEQMLEKKREWLATNPSGIRSLRIVVSSKPSTAQGAKYASVSVSRKKVAPSSLKKRAPFRIFRYSLQRANMSSGISIPGSSSERSLKNCTSLKALEGDGVFSASTSSSVFFLLRLPQSRECLLR